MCLKIRKQIYSKISEITLTTAENLKKQIKYNTIIIIVQYYNEDLNRSIGNYDTVRRLNLR